MWKQTLLQMMIALLPYFAYQIRFERSKASKEKSPFIMLISVCAVLISCMICSASDRYDMGFYFIPLLLGSLYGGRNITLLLFLVYAAGWLVHYGFVPWSLLELAGVMAVLLPCTYLCVNRFNRSSRRARHLIMALLVTLIVALKETIFMIYPATADYRLETLLIHSARMHVVLYFLLYYFVAWLGIFMIENYTERQRLHRQVLELSDSYRIEMQKLKQLIDENPLGVVFVDQNGLITHLNGRAIQLYKRDYPGEDCLIGSHYNVLEDREGGRRLTRLLEQALAGEQVATEYVQESSAMYAHTGISVRDTTNGQVVGAAVIIHDMTELTRLRSEIGQMERLSLVGQMAASITHEIRNPMAVIRGFVQLMRERGQADQQEYFRIVIEELDRANSIISDFLSLAQNRVIEKENCSLHEIILEIAPLIWADANMRGIELQFQLSDEMPSLMLNPKEMKQLILNLARNGMEALEQGGQLTIATAVTQGEIELRIMDNGIGIPQEQLDRLFEPFYTTKSRGTGLGLPLCLSIVERHGGKIRVESTEGLGTTFVVSFKPDWAGESRPHSDSSSSKGA